MRIAFVALSAPGHLNPTTALARQLQSRNHEVAIISLPDAEPYVRAAVFKECALKPAAPMRVNLRDVAAGGAHAPPLAEGSRIKMVPSLDR